MPSMNTDVPQQICVYRERLSNSPSRDARKGIAFGRLPVAA
ncbi:hypothetical protein [Nocardia vaccinii]|nr:hypothetical protein [Nocardia vaccinii]